MPFDVGRFWQTRSTFHPQFSGNLRANLRPVYIMGNARRTPATHEVQDAGMAQSSAGQHVELHGPLSPRVKCFYGAEMPFKTLWGLSEKSLVKMDSKCSVFGDPF